MPTLPPSHHGWITMLNITLFNIRVSEFDDHFNWRHAKDLNVKYTLNPRYSTFCARQKVLHFKKVIQWGLEYRTQLDFERSARVPISNGLVLECLSEIFFNSKSKLICSVCEYLWTKWLTFFPMCTVLAQAYHNG